MAELESTEDEQFYDVLDFSPSPERSTYGRDELEKCGHWLLSIPRGDMMSLRETPEYADFLKSFEKLGHAHRRVLFENAEGAVELENGSDSASSFSFMQHMAADDVVLRVFEFLECRALIRASTTCSRFRDLTHKSATQRTHQIGKERTLDHIFKLLCAKEEIEGSSSMLEGCHVPVPMLGLPKRVLVRDAGDNEYNGIYYCTGCDGNGFVFTKPRYDQSQLNNVQSTRSFITNPLTLEEIENPHLDPDLPQAPSSDPNAKSTKPGQLLRCIITKKFSNQTILWYMSKEVETPVDESIVEKREVTQQYSFWAKIIDEYPSQTATLTEHLGQGWQPLAGTRLTSPPTVELIN
mmetsp:Transcript_831/g.1280  ORF Transcript_831/g.1280 Transcript_831/m.1280 type:complete len:351 (+) Transcript_831:98-1150(+)|eukprot:CAMPEP_0194226908 /NCGR_PEP_ID=MMETSP0156-20130528/42587_1 /TAXON_ID=33649 /ORGANISM="Thalassionema nitzschioides, Strain L26-B" /LENGTH=350 /DNA_ID=CAMNT_0038959375 /DNA_START=69 /DNA_END=1121 /DNA_ORIENTATION=+